MNIHSQFFGIAFASFCLVTAGAITVFSASSQDYMLTEDTFSVTENNESTSDIMSESTLLPIQMLGEGGTTFIERTHELSVCGNNVSEFQESCDGTDVGGALCSDFGYNTGVVTCSTDCTTVLTTSCSTVVPTTPTPTPVVVTSVPSVSVSTSSGSGGGGGKNLLLTITPAPTEEPFYASAPSVTPVIASSPTLPPVRPEVSDVLVLPSTPEISRVDDTPIQVLEDTDEGSQNTDDTSSVLNAYLGDVTLPEVTAYPDTSPDLSGVDLNATPIASLLYELDAQKEENPRLNELLHFAAGENGEGLNNKYSVSSLPCSWVILLIVFLLGMLTEYILSSILLFRKK